jgi:hypothetical protein
MSYTGRCACGKVRLEINGSPVAVRQCGAGNASISPAAARRTTPCSIRPT